MVSKQLKLDFKLICNHVTWKYLSAKDKYIFSTYKSKNENLSICECSNY